MRAKTMWEADGAVAESFLSVFGGRSTTPEKRLCAAVLLAAIDEFEGKVRGNVRAEDAEFRRLEDWFSSHDQRWPFSFENVCAALNLEAGCIRSRLAAIRSGALAA